GRGGLRRSGCLRRRCRLRCCGWLCRRRWIRSQRERRRKNGEGAESARKRAQLSGGHLKGLSFARPFSSVRRGFLSAGVAALMMVGGAGDTGGGRVGATTGDDIAGLGCTEG